MSKINIRPKNGAKVTNPENGEILPENGQEVENSIYWQRRINDGDVEVAQPQLSADDETSAPIGFSIQGAKTKAKKEDDK